MNSLENSMPLMVRLYLNTSLANVILFIMLALWGVVNAIRNRTVTPNYAAALLISQVILFALSLFYVGLRLTGQLTTPIRLPLLYHVVALLVFPCVRLYMDEQSPRRASLITAVACVFTVSILIRALQTGVGLH